MSLKTYLTAPSKCFIPKCKAHCCTNAPLPEHFLERFPHKIQRQIYSAINIGKNSIGDPFDSIIYNTTPNPIQIVGQTTDGKLIYGIPGELLKAYNIKSQQQVDELMRSYNQFDNYCPFITEYAKCSVYKDRPPICREFGTMPDRQNRCHEKVSRLDIAKYYVKDFLNFYWNIIKSVKNKITNVFKPKKANKNFEVNK